MRNLNTSAFCTETSEKCDWMTVSRSARLHCKSNNGAFLTVYIKYKCLLWGVRASILIPMRNLNTSAFCTETSENVTERPFLGQHGFIARTKLSHFWPSIYRTNVCYGVYELVFRSPCATSNTSAFCTETSENVSEQPFLGQHGSIARATLSHFWPSI
jgi:hypothetical protein